MLPIQPRRDAVPLSHCRPPSPGDEVRVIRGVEKHRVVHERPPRLRCRRKRQGRRTRRARALWALAAPPRAAIAHARAYGTRARGRAGQTERGADRTRAARWNSARTERGRGPLRFSLIRVRCCCAGTGVRRAARTRRATAPRPMHRRARCTAAPDAPPRPMHRRARCTAAPDAPPRPM
eukprot:gene13530-biopygen2002